MPELAQQQSSAGGEADPPCPLDICLACTGGDGAENEAAHALSPMQAGMLFQSVLADGGESSEGFDLEQMHLALGETIEPEMFALAWKLVLRRHPALAVRFSWEGVSQPVQVLEPDTAVPVEFQDWEGLDAVTLAGRRRDFLETDRARGFDLRRAPLMRVTVFRTGPATSEVVWTFHHILMDGRSMGTVLEEVFTIYGGVVRGDAPSLPVAPASFFDYIHWLGRGDRERSHQFYRELLVGKTAPCPLPLAEPMARPTSRRGGGEVSRLLPAELRLAAHALARRSGTTVGTVFQAAWALVLARLNGDNDVLFGTARACRNSVALAGALETVGLFMNTLPLRVRLDEDEAVLDLLRRLRQQSIDLREHEHTPLVEIHRQSELPPQSPLFESLLMFENRELNRVLRGRDPAWDGRTCTLYERPAVPLTLIVVDDAQLQLRILFDRRRFRDEVVTRLVSYVEAAIAGLATQERVWEVDILPADERRRTLLAWNDTARPFPDNECLHTRFERQVLRQPEAIAVECGAESLTFAALEARANRLAHALIERGAKPGTYVGLCLERGAQLVVGLLAIAKSGAAYVPLDPTYPPERLAFMAADAGVLLVLTQRRHQDLFSSSRLVLDDEATTSELSRCSSAAPGPRASATDVCYAIYTSGSTGQPKGVVLTHRAVMNTVDWVSRTWEVSPGDRLLFVTSVCFDLSVYDTFGVLGAGATVVVADSELLQDPQRLADAVRAQRITIWDSAPAALQRLVSFLGQSSGKPDLRLVMLSGDYIPLSLPDALRDAFPGVQVLAMGGATEAAIWSNYFLVGAVDGAWTSIPYGRPIQNARYHVLDARLRPVAIGVPGDLYIGGACLAQGYLGRPELTRERFIPDPFLPPPSGATPAAPERLYRTGDLARYFEDGTLEFLGRRDFQVKIRGFRVELGEVECALAALPGVRECVCAAHLDASGQKSLVAYVVLEPECCSLTAEDIKTKLAEQLPDFMVPSQVALLDAMPVSSNGKIDRKALPSVAAISAARPGELECLEPRNDRERRMVAIWKELLKVDSVSISDNFFALGGHSLLAVMLVARLQSEFSLEIPLSRILEHPTIASLADSLEGPALKQAAARHLVTLNRKGSRTPLVLMAGIGGFGFVFEGLARFLGQEQPLHILHAVGAQDESEGTNHSIERMAEIYEPEVLAACGDGPIIVGGYSFGMLVAFELAERLRRRGHPVPLLVSFDGFAPGFPELLPLRKRLVEHAKIFFGADSQERRAYLKDRALALRARAYRQLGRPEDGITNVATGDAETDRRLKKVSAGLWEARGNYRPSHRNPGNLLLIKTDIAEEWIGNRMDDPLYGWQSWTSGTIQVFSVPGKHLNLFEDANQRRCADILTTALAACVEQPA